MLQTTTYLPPKSRWISAKVLPLVSGTRRRTKSTPRAVMPLKIQNVAAMPIPSTKSPNVFVTMNVRVQLRETAKAAATLLIDAEKISAIIIHGRGPKPRENVIMKSVTLRSGSQPILATDSGSSAFKWKYTPEDNNNKN